MNILLIGQLALHWGRLEYGNMGNYYIIEPLIREIHRVFPEAVIKTVFQMTEGFCKREKIEVLPMELYYGYRENELELARNELKVVESIVNGILFEEVPPYIEAVLNTDIVIDFSGDMWSDNADVAGKDRFEVGVIKDLIAQKLGKPIFMLAGSPGPYDMTVDKLELARKVFAGFDMVTNREPVSMEILQSYGFDVSNVRDCACPSFLFEGENELKIFNKIKSYFVETERPIIGFILCGWNFKETPFSKWPRDDKEYENFVELIEKLCEKTEANICLISHSNGFPIPPAKFELQHGRDYYVVEQLYRILQTTKCKGRVALVEDVYNVWQTKGIIGNFDMLISGRVHGAIAGISQCVPTMIIDYGQEPKAHKLWGFASLVELEEYVADPAKTEELLEKALMCWDNRKDINTHLLRKIPLVQELARENLNLVRAYLEERKFEI